MGDYCRCTGGCMNCAPAGVGKPIGVAAAETVATKTVAGALFDFAAFLTGHPEAIAVGVAEPSMLFRPRAVA